ncbi:expressed unknown protein [Seminavis robusta]|uniref:BTB domain-containing protein n=1 Tax=Seminavis robusta TaxID=568900 RepID=A0A9N8H6Q1_9STRA|nr:expressed unknown protein [Seminavis robusta]|eukprot:Sro118_g057840.1 n/a (437) ;mRNA; f:87725-89035
MAPKGITFEQAFASLRTKFHDVTLKGNDEVTVRANRTALASRCEFFEKLFFSDFKEAQCETVQIGFPGAVLEATVEYILTNKVAILDNPNSNEAEALEKLRTVLLLASAAAYFDLEELGEMIKKAVTTFVEDAQPSLCFAVLEESLKNNLSEEFEEVALAKIHSNTSNCLHGTAIRDVHLSVLKRIFLDDRIKSSLPAFRAFELVQAWARTESAEDKTVAAKSLIVEHVDLETIAPLELSSNVSSSGLVTLEQLTEAYKRQALRAAEVLEFPIRQVFGQKLTASFTVTSTGWISNCIACAPITEGKHQWTIDVKKDINTHIWLGIATPTGFSTTLQQKTYLGTGVWSYRGNCQTHNQCQTLSNGMTFAQGSRVTLTLSLCPNDVNHGSLSISVDGNSPVTSFTNLCNFVGDGGFMPVVTMHYCGSSVELVDKMELV